MPLAQHQPEPCLRDSELGESPPCRSPIACGAFGYCRFRNQRWARAEDAREWIEIAKQRKIEHG